MSGFFEHLIGPKAEILTAGLAGAVVAAVTEWTTVPAALRKIVVGTLSSVFLWPIGVPILKFLLAGVNIPDTNAAGMSGFMVGVLGVVIIEFVLRAFRFRFFVGGKNDRKD